MHKTLRVAVLSFAAVGLLASPAFAEIEILESNVSDLEAGRRFPTEAALKVPPGGQIRILDLANGQSKMLMGPPLSETNNHAGATASRALPYGGMRGEQQNAPQTGK